MWGRTSLLALVALLASPHEASSLTSPQYQVIFGAAPQPSSGPGSCPASQSFFLRAAANIAAAPPALVAVWQPAVDNLICGQVTAGTWSNKDVEYFLMAPTLALAEMNLVSASYSLTAFGSLSFLANSGIGGDGATGYFDTGYGPSSGQMTVASASMNVCVLNNRGTGASTAIEIGSAENGANAYIQPLNVNVSVFALLSANTLQGSWATNVQNGFSVSRTVANPQVFYAFVGGAQSGNSQNAVGVMAGMPHFFVLALDDTGTPDNFSNDVLALVSAGGGKTNAQVQSDHTLFTAAINAMGVARQC